ncbi:hypothetical protein AAMO2058_000143300 [Amorphochlora amoebiformis]
MCRDPACVAREFSSMRHKRGLKSVVKNEGPSGFPHPNLADLVHVTLLERRCIKRQKNSPKSQRLCPTIPKDHGINSRFIPHGSMSIKLFASTREPRPLVCKGKVSLFGESISSGFCIDPDFKPRTTSKKRSIHASRVSSVPIIAKEDSLNSRRAKRKVSKGETPRPTKKSRLEDNRKRQESPDGSPNDREEYPVIAIHLHELGESGIMFLVEWESPKGKSPELTWEPYRHVRHLLPKMYRYQWIKFKEGLPPGCLAALTS